jgi:hypothetical protein
LKWGEKFVGQFIRSDRKYFVAATKFSFNLDLSCATAPCAGVDAAGIQNKGGFDGGGIAATASSLENSDYGRHAKDFPSAKGAYNPILLYQKINVVLCRTLAGQTGQGST